MKVKLSLRKVLSKKYITFGQGIEIGPTFLPLPVEKGLRVTYVDVVSRNDLINLYPSLKDKNVVDIDVVDDGETLSKFPDNSLDFIIANHFLEHTINPIKTINNFLRKLHPNGLIFMAIPDRRATFDKERPLTDPKHLIDVFERGVDIEKYNHYVENTRIVEKLPENKIKKRVKELIGLKFSIHYHTFQIDNFLPIIEYMIKHHMDVKLEEVVDLQEGTDEFIVVLRKKKDFLSRNVLSHIRNIVLKLTNK